MALATGWCKMYSIVSNAPHREDDDISSGGPIAALVIAVPISVLLWGLVFAILFTLIH